MGDLDLLSNQRVGLAVDKIYNHPGFDATFVENDIALIRLERPVTFTKSVRPACLPKDDGELYVGKTAVVTGWGSTEFGKSCKL